LRTKIPEYADLVHHKLSHQFEVNVFGFIDGTLQKICHPKYNQKAAYSGHKRCHGIKFQSVFSADGFYMHFYGPIAGSCHDSFMLRESELLPQLQRLFPDGRYHIYGDLGIFGGYREPQAGSVEARFNTTMSSVREVVEWGFKEIAVQFRFLDFRASMKVYKQPVGQYYYVGAFFLNLRSCFYGNQTAEYFDTVTMDLDEYLDLVHPQCKV
jgi:nuclease HARBI1